MRKLTALIVASGLMVGALNMAHAEDAKPVPPQSKTAVKMMKPSPGMMMFKGLDLTDAQKKQIGEIMKAQHEAMTPPAVDERKAMQSIIASDTFDRAKAEREVNKMAEKQKARVLANMESQNKIYNVLTPEQKQKYNANFEKRLTEHKAPRTRVFTCAD